MKNRSKSFINNTTGDKIMRKQPYMNMFSTNKNPSTIHIINIQPELKQQKSNNYVFKNKKNLRNFFRERIKKQDYYINNKSKMISPAKILQLKKEQSSKQDFTKIILNKSVEIDNFPKSPTTKKIIQTFSFKSRQISKKLIKQDDRYKRVGTSLTNYLTPTANSIIKRSQTAKKQAYIGVFGDKTIQLKQKILSITYGSSFYTKKQKIKNISKNRPKTRLQQQKITDQQKQKLGILLQRLQRIAFQVNPHRFDFFKTKNLQQQQFSPLQHKISKTKKTEETELLQGVKSVSQNYKKRNQDFGMKHLRTVQDIQQFDPKFYQQMIAHKNNRLWIRNKVACNKQPSPNQKNGIQSIQRSFQFDILKKQRQNKQTNDSLSAIMTITERLNGTIQNQQDINENKTKAIQPKTKRTIIINFCRMLIEMKNKAVLFGIKFQNIYEALLRTRIPYELQGSYALFKLVKSGEIEKVKSFINKNIQYSYQVDSQGRTLLIYAVQNNQTEISNFLMKIGVNIDAKAYNGNTALFCAIKKNNYEIIESLLRAGACPWSTSMYNINQLIKSCQKKIKIVIKNARKMHIGLKLYRKPKQRYNFWLKRSQECIKGNQLINF